MAVFTLTPENVQCTSDNNKHVTRQGTVTTVWNARQRRKSE